MISAYRLLAGACDYPLHLGVTEAGPAFQGTVKSAVAFGVLLSEGIGDTIRVSLRQHLATTTLHRLVVGRRPRPLNGGCLAGNPVDGTSVCR